MARAWGFNPRDQQRVARATSVLASTVANGEEGGTLEIKLLMGRQVGVEIVAHGLEEMLGLSIIEAMTCSKPVIVTNIWALNSLIENGETGILVEPKRSDVLADAIGNLLTDRKLRERIGRRARRVVQELFTIERMAKEMVRVYGELAGQNAQKSLQA